MCYKDYHEVYTNVSKIQNKSGISSYTKKLNIFFKLFKKCCVFVAAKIIAILESIKNIVNEGHLKYIILKESMNALNSVIKKFELKDL